MLGCNLISYVIFSLAFILGAHLLGGKSLGILDAEWSYAALVPHRFIDSSMWMSQLSTSEINKLEWIQSGAGVYLISALCITYFYHEVSDN